MDPQLTGVSRSVLDDTRRLADQLSSVYTDTLVSSASDIANYNERRDAMGEVDRHDLFFYALGLILYRHNAQRSWNAPQRDDVFVALATDLSSQMVYAGADPAKVQGEHTALVGRMRTAFEATTNNFQKILSDDADQKSIYDFFMLSLFRAFAGAANLFEHKDFRIFMTLMQQFGTRSMTEATSVVMSRPGEQDPSK